MPPIILPSDYTLVTAKVWYLEMHQPPVKTLAPRPEAKLELLTGDLSVTDYREDYFGVGEKWDWLDRMVMPDAELYDLINRHDTRHYRFFIGQVKAGLAEYVLCPEFTEIQYFGLFPDFVGKGWGLYFLQQVIAQAWQFGSPRVQLNTCSLDHPNALSVYQKAGFVIVKEEEQVRKKRKERVG